MHLRAHIVILAHLAMAASLAAFAAAPTSPDGTIPPDAVPAPEVPAKVEAAPQLPVAQSPAKEVPPKESAPASAGETVVLPTIVVTGLRGSMEKSLEIKKNAPIVLDSINATELGRFPDDDVADSLSHITGISITRTTGGEGQYVGVRGLGSQYNIVTLNNRILATDDDGRDLAFDVLPADVISGADVLKSSQASAIEGSIGGTVNLRSARPFDDPGFHSAIRAEKNYNDMSYFSGSKLSAFASNTSENGQMGFLVGAVYSDTKTRTDALNYNTYDPSNPGVWPLSGPSSQPVVAACCISFGSVVDEKERGALSGTFEWRPTGDFKLVADALFTRLHDPQVGYNQAYYPDFNYDAMGNPEWSNVVVKNGLITSFTANNFTPEIVNNTIDRVVNTSLFGLNGTWKPRANLSFTGDIYRSRAIRPEGGNDAFVTAGLVSPTPYNQDTINWTNTNNGLPNILVTLPNGQNYATALASGELNNNYWNTHYVGLNGYTIHDAVTGTSIDGSYTLDSGVFERIDFGIADTRRVKSRWDVSNDWTNGSSQYNLYNTPLGQTPITFGSLGANVISTINFPNFMMGSGGSFPTTMPVFNVPALLAALQRMNGMPNPSPPPGFPSTYDFSLTLPQYNAVNSYSVSEHTLALYGETTFSGTNWSGNAGLRLVRTDTSASTSVNNINSVTIQNTADPTNPAYVIYSPPTPTTTYGSYTVPLPSTNFSYWLDRTLQLRLGAAETLTRPELNQLAPTRTDNTINRVYEITYAGNSELKPIRAYQMDVSLEWYYRPKSAITLAVFGKKLKDFITTGTQDNVNLGVPGYFNGSTTPVPILYTIYEPINGDRGLVSGLELGFQHLFDNGFGVRAQYTHDWTKAWVQGQFVGQLEGVAPSSASLGVLYEAGPISANLSWDYTGRFVAQTFTEVPGWPAISNSFSWVTASGSYQISKELKFYVEGKNLTDSVVKTFLNGRSDAIWSSGTTGTSSSVGQGYSAYGRTFTAGLSYRF